MDETIDVLIEIPRGSRNKYEVDHHTGRIRLDRRLFAATTYPTEYGFIPETLSEDGDPLDVLVLISEPTFPGCVVRARPLGALDMTDDKGHDYKILAVANDDPRWERVDTMADLAPHRLREIENFFETYKTLEKRESRVEGWLEIDDAWRIIDEALELGSREVTADSPQPGTWR